MRKLRATRRRPTGEEFDNYWPASEITNIKRSSVTRLQSEVCDRLSVKFGRFLGFERCDSHQRQTHPAKQSNNETKNGRCHFERSFQNHDTGLVNLEIFVVNLFVHFLHSFEHDRPSAMLE